MLKELSEKKEGLRFTVTNHLSVVDGPATF